MLIHRPDYFIVRKVRDDNVAFVRDMLYGVCGDNQPFSSLLGEFVRLGLGTVPDENGEGSVDVFFAPLCEVAGHGIAHRAETDEAYLDSMVTRGTWTGEGVGFSMLLLDMEEVSVLGPIHGGRERK